MKNKIALLILALVVFTSMAAVKPLAGLTLQNRNDATAYVWVTNLDAQYYFSIPAKTLQHFTVLPGVYEIKVEFIDQPQCVPVLLKDIEITGVVNKLTFAPCGLKNPPGEDPRYRKLFGVLVPE